MRVLVFGGSFDPPHRGHAALLAAAAKSVQPDRILVVPAFHAPLKDAPPAAPAGERLALVRLGVIAPLPARWREKSFIDPAEARGGERAYTVETLKRLREEYPRAELHFVCGQDAAASFPKWKEPARLRELATWWYGARRGSKAAPPAFFRRVPGTFPALSSTELRASLALGEDCTDALSPAVLSRIELRGSYGTGLLERLRATLKPGRYEHTLNVASLAGALARRHGLDEGKARLAGLLHDAGRRFPPPLLAEYVRKRRLKIPEGALTAALEPMLLHAYVSEDLARGEFGVRDAEVLSAVRKHTLGDLEMSPLDKAVYVADACSADRRHPGVDETRELAFGDLDAAFERCLADKLSDALRRRAWLHPLTIELWNILAAR
ncbi:MAG TPA: bis(5'-nucleosyl)-tetraphosphatase (symmetrical) YqeK [Elusimicrobiota bacterium]|nr:bis(5'-nucleosyl)-tetraphosphatase (symmetrical) YqeK [Elusimicrobiota bacterium]